MPPKRRLVILLVAALFGLAVLWRWLAMEDLLSAQALKEQLDALSAWRGHPLVIPAVMALYGALLLTMFPLSILVVLTGLLFGSGWGFLYATLGTLTSSAVTYWVGSWMGQSTLQHYAGQRVNRLSRYIGDRGIRTMIVINLLPIAPFTLTNLMAGASHMKFPGYMIGSTIGIVPGLAVVTVLGSQIGALLSATDKSDVALAVGIVAACVALLVFAPRWLQRRTGPHDR